MGSHERLGAATVMGHDCSEHRPVLPCGRNEHAGLCEVTDVVEMRLVTEPSNLLGEPPITADVDEGEMKLAIRCEIAAHVTISGGLFDPLDESL
jgi:hypothetical protein